MGLDGLSTAIIPTAKSDPFSNSNSPFFADKENSNSPFFRGQRKHGLGVPYCRFERQMVTEKRSQIQSVSKRNPDELDETSPFSINPRLKLQVQNSNSDIKS